MERTDYDEIEFIVETFQENKITAVKYNNTLDDEGQRASSYASFINVSGDGERLIITNKVKINDEYVLENDPEEIQRQKDEKKQIE